LLKPGDFSASGGFTPGADISAIDINKLVQVNQQLMLQQKLLLENKEL
jgi:hypothetical protein